jgi:protein-disulfide isomerase
MKRIHWLIIVLLISLGVTAYLLRDDPFVAKLKTLSIKPPKSTISISENVGSENTNFSPQQIVAIEKIVHSYLLNNPEILIELDRKLQEREIAKQKVRTEKTKEKIEKYKSQLFDEKLPGRVILGNPAGEITIVEFTQHQCPACKKASVILEQISQTNPEVRIIVIYWPFLGENAVHTAKAMLAAQKQNKAKLLDKLIVNHHRTVDKEQLESIIAEQQELDGKLLRLAMLDSVLDKALEDNFTLANNLDLSGTPAFIVANKELSKIVFVPGYTNNCKQELINAINEVKMKE